MGLDMYLTKRTYVKNWDYTSEKQKISITLSGNTRGINPDRIEFIEEEMLYWRKANAIHNWFVENCQEGIDNCQPSEVSRNDLQKLLSVVNLILDEADTTDRDVIAKKMLPPQNGFFFGSAEIDSWYYKDLKNTQEGLKSILAERDRDESYIYRSSW
jgi:hypothetical protein